MRTRLYFGSWGSCEGYKATLMHHFLTHLHTGGCRRTQSWRQHGREACQGRDRKLPLETFFWTCWCASVCGKYRSRLRIAEDGCKELSYVHACACLYTFLCTCVCVCMYVCVYVYIYIYIYIYSKIHPNGSFLMHFVWITPCSHERASLHTEGDAMNTF
jgi:hypothetical protein